MKGELSNNMNSELNETKAFAELSCQLTKLGAELREDLFDGKTVIVACNEKVEKQCIEITQKVFNEFDYDVNVKAIRKDNVVRMKNIF